MKVYFSESSSVCFSESGAIWTIDQIIAIRAAGMAIEVIYL